MAEQVTIALTKGRILKETLLPNYDETFSGLMEDLTARGLLENTLVVVMSDMGRTPKINAPMKSSVMTAWRAETTSLPIR